MLVFYIITEVFYVIPCFLKVVSQFLNGRGPNISLAPSLP